MATSWFPRSAFYDVQVTGGRVVAALDSSGEPASFALTIDDIWNRVLAARSTGELNSAIFDRAGVPVETDIGSWAADGGVHYSVRRFTPTR